MSHVRNVSVIVIVACLCATRGRYNILNILLFVVVIDHNISTSWFQLMLVRLRKRSDQYHIKIQLARHGEGKERYKKEQKSSEDGREEFSGVTQRKKLHGVYRE